MYVYHYISILCTLVYYEKERESHVPYWFH